MPPRQEQTPNDTSFTRLRPLRSATYVRRSSTGAPIDIVGNSYRPQNSKKPQHNLSQPKINPNLSLNDVIRPTIKKLEKRKVEPALPRQKRSEVLHRSTFGPKIARKTRAKIKRRSRIMMPSLVTVMAFLLFFIGLGVSFSVWRTNHDAKARVQVLAKSTEEGNGGDLPDETDPDASTNSSYQVAPDLPRYLRIKKINVDARIKRLGVKNNNELKAPSNIFDVGWYEGSSKPGENGTVVLDGHISGPTKRGVFYSLGNLRTGDKISIEKGDGTIINYAVIKTQLYAYDKVDMPALLTSAEPGKPGLNLITCSGRFDVRTNKYEDRLVIFAVQD